MKKYLGIGIICMIMLAVGLYSFVQMLWEIGAAIHYACTVTGRCYEEEK